ncbi:CPK2 [Symbiodinium natans]|uniref:CPK2 protein n=1 Tax=Symbiodinium natans TaxID=878477 RepID=A0A812MN24_9DINO|nr:CPK2 [Symbiodinium natans]
MSVHPGDVAAGATVRSGKKAQKAWTQPEFSDLRRDGSSKPAPPTETPPPLEADELPVKKRASGLSALLPPATAKVSPSPSQREATGSPKQHDTKSLMQEEDSQLSIGVGVRLADVNLIIIGDCAEARELLRRRRLTGGRACLLWTNRRPREPRVQTEAVNVDLHSAMLDMASFVWSPPPLSTSATRAVQEMRRKHGCSAKGMSRFGPDILDLRDVECYRVLVDKFGNECGIEVYDEFRGNLLWALSGAVVFCGASFVGKAPVVCSSMGQAARLDVSVDFEEAKPLVTTTHGTVAAAFLQNFLFLVVYLWIMGHFEARADASVWPWWRLSWAAVGFFFGWGFFPQYWGITLGGRVLPIWFRIFGSLCNFLCNFLLLLPLQWTLDRSSTAGMMTTCAVFTTCVGGCSTYLFTSICVLIAFHRFSRGQTRLDWLRHSAWTFAHLVTTLGTWIFLYGIALIYIYVQAASPQLAAVFLAFSTSGTEKCVSKVLNFSYTTFIYTPRCSINGSKDIRGDQRRFLTIPVAITHAYCEAVRLVSLLSVTVRNPGWEWLPSILLNTGVNLMERTQLMLSLAVRILPWCDWLCPGLSVVILHDVKLHCGYAQYVAVLALLVAGAGYGGMSTASIFNVHGLLLIFCCILLEVMEDVLVHLLPRSDYWRRRLSPYYEKQPLMHPKQLVLIDHQGSNFDAVPLALHGQRSLDLAEVCLLMWPSSLFTYVLMTLLLGAGYVHGVCDAPIPRELRVLDALIWETPLRCA